MKTINILVEDWQYQCCGSNFCIGDNIGWLVTDINETGYNILDIDNLVYLYEECAGGKDYISGIIRRIVLYKRLDNIAYEKIEKKEEYNSSDELANKNKGFYYMVVTLEIEN